MEKGYFVSLIDGIKGWGEVGRILSSLSLYAWSDFVFEIQQALKTCNSALPPGLAALPFLLG